MKMMDRMSLGIICIETNKQLKTNSPVKLGLAMGGWLHNGERLSKNKNGKLDNLPKFFTEVQEYYQSSGRSCF